jgi:RNA polymerase sigma-70 factor, ECF subfamily
METIVADSEFARLLYAAQEGDEAAFAELFRSVQPRLLRYLRTLGGSLADDVAAETWLSVVRGLKRFRGDRAGWQSWVFTIARARLVDAQRRADRTPQPIDADVVLQNVPGSSDVSGSVDEMFSTEAALALIGRLPRQQAEVVLLRHVAGLDVTHTARVLGRRAGAVRVADHRGLRRLAELLTARDAARGQAGDSSGDPIGHKAGGKAGGETRDHTRCNASGAAFG